MHNDKLILTLFALGSLGLLGLSFYFLSDSNHNDNAKTTMQKTNLTSQQLSTFTPPPDGYDTRESTQIANNNSNRNDYKDNNDNNDNNDNYGNNDTNDNTVLALDDIDENITSNEQTPTEFIQAYFSALKNVPYEQTWDMQSANFQANNSLEKYKKWWSKQVDSVRVEKVIAASKQEVTIRLRYQMKNGRKVCSIDTFNVIQSTTGWLIDKQKYRNCR